MDPLSRWRELMERPAEEIPLDEAALVFAAQGDSSLDVRAQLLRLDQLADQVEAANTEGVCRLLFGTLAIRGDRQTYEDPRNSYLHQVLDRRLGIPISLSVLLIEVARRRGITLEGVGMPGHFLVRDPGSPDLLIDAFSGGSRLDRTACAELLHATVGPEAELVTSMLAPVGRRSILARMLANLEISFRRRNDKNGQRWVARFRAAIPGLPPADRLALAESLAGLGCIEEAAAILGELAEDPSTPRGAAPALRARARGLHAPFN